MRVGLTEGQQGLFAQDKHCRGREGSPRSAGKLRQLISMFMRGFIIINVKELFDAFTLQSNPNQGLGASSMSRRA